MDIYEHIHCYSIAIAKSMNIANHINTITKQLYYKILKKNDLSHFTKTAS